MKQDPKNESHPNKIFKFRTAATPADFDEARRLLHEYAQFLSIDLSFQNFQREIRTLDVQYNQPTGTMILAFSEDRAVACIGVRKFSDGIAELKRMFVEEEYRGYHLGKQLVKEALDAAKNMGYKSIRLDTLASMKRALKLYISHSFKEIPPYRFNPLKGVSFLEKELE